MTGQSNAILLVGSGPGIGRNTAAVFAEKGFRHVILMSRDAGRLAEDAAFVKEKAGPASSPRVDTVPVDLSNLDAVREALADVERKLENSKVPLQVVHHNAARVGPSKLDKFPVEELEKDMKIAVSSMYLIAQWATPKLLQLAQTSTYSAQQSSKSKPAFLVTSGLLWTDPFPHLISLSAVKAAQHNLVHSLHKHYTPKGVHFGLVVVGGVVSDEAKLTTPKNVADEFFKLWEQPVGKFELEKTMLDPAYEDVVNQRGEDGAKD